MLGDFRCAFSSYKCSSACASNFSIRSPFPVYVEIPIDADSVGVSESRDNTSRMRAATCCGSSCVEYSPARAEGVSVLAALENFRS